MTPQSVAAILTKWRNGSGGVVILLMKLANFSAFALEVRKTLFVALLNNVLKYSCCEEQHEDFLDHRRSGKTRTS